MIKQIENSDLVLEDLPDPRDVDGVVSFALSFNGYEFSGGFRECAEAARQTQRGTLSELRNELFFAARASHHAGSNERLMSVYKEVLPLIRNSLDGDSG
jgi:hypothetical protein